MEQKTSRFKSKNLCINQVGNAANRTNEKSRTKIMFHTHRLEKLLTRGRTMGAYARLTSSSYV